MLENIKKNYEKEIQEILEALKYGYYEELDEYTFEDDVVFSFNEHYQKPFTWACGASKGVLIFKNFGFVIKIPFNYCDGEMLCGAYEGDDDWNYCTQEKNRYQKAKQNRLQNIFLETSYLCNVDEHPVYIQMMAEPLNQMSFEEAENKNKSSADNKKIIKIIDIENDYAWINNIWEADVFTLYGGKYYHKLKTFIKENNIEDLRDANIGYVGIYPVILDYAGFDN